MTKTPKRQATPLKSPDLSIVIPAFNEERRVGKTLNALAEFLDYNAFLNSKSVEVVVVAADASDRTLEIVESKMKLFHNLLILKPGPRAGKGRDVQYGMLRAHGKYVVFMDADLATPLRYIEVFYKACQTGSDVVVGIRDHLVRHPALLERWASNFGNRIFTLLSGVKVSDTQCGFKMFHGRVAQSCFSRQTLPGWWFDIEILTIARINNLSILPITVEGWEEMPFSTYDISNIRTAATYTADTFRILRNRLNGTYKA